MQSIILIRYGEIVLKGHNRPIFEKKLIKNIKNAIQKEKFRIEHSQARIFLEPIDRDTNIDETIQKLTKVFGIVSVSAVIKTKSNMDDIFISAKECMSKMYGIQTFKVATKRGDKGFPLNSQEISKEVGAYILKEFPDLKVDVNKPQIILFVEVRENAYIYSEIIHGCGGLPTGTNGKAMVLISGGIDSPTAGWMLAKRGVEIEAVHFFSPPYTGPKAKEKVIQLCGILSSYVRKIKLHVVPFTNIQVELKNKCPEEQLTVLMRRFMMKIAEKIAINSSCSALITGENLGQVASQTMQGLVASNSVVQMPIFRPLIGMDKNEIVELSRKIGTYETSILPYEDCCTIFLPRRPETKPRVDKLLMSEEHLDIEKLINEAITNTEIIEINN